jgi:hypothetical protein
MESEGPLPEGGLGHAPRSHPFALSPYLPGDKAVTGLHIVPSLSKLALSTYCVQPGLGP